MNLSRARIAVLKAVPGSAPFTESNSSKMEEKSETYSEDMTAAMGAVVSKLQKAINLNGGVTYIHCTSGLGRAPATSVCALKQNLRFRGRGGIGLKSLLWQQSVIGRHLKNFQKRKGLLLVDLHNKISAGQRLGRSC
ncbi:uncharacterized protein [Henckelia pumila]|uniref:uncharacterized protein n=1 Tax=Henckelia pumila TaxID=405737 RepID=UPI003C6E7204